MPCQALQGYQCLPGSTTPSGTQCPTGTASLGNATLCTVDTYLALTDREVVSYLYNSMGGAFWRNNAGWTATPFAPCSAFGVTCTSTGRVIGLALPSNNVSGTIPAVIGMLSLLSTLDLSGNNIVGSVPVNVSQLSSLMSLNLCGNSFAPNTTAVALPATNTLTAATVRLTLSACGTPCVAGFVCSPYSLSSRGAVCPVNSYCPSGTTAALPCPAGSNRTAGATSLSACTASSSGGTPACTASPGTYCKPDGEALVERTVV